MRSDFAARFQRFRFTPLAAASIGQAHEARLKDGRRLAVKAQYPGMERSIDNDVDNVAALFRVLPCCPARSAWTTCLPRPSGSSARRPTI
jgi:predicted unusual protein kinase regulating ubiquinone biosynthesis (AarF/ABC1/UbiB family)